MYGNWRSKMTIEHRMTCSRTRVKRCWYWWKIKHKFEMPNEHGSACWADCNVQVDSINCLFFNRQLFILYFICRRMQSVGRDRATHFRTRWLSPCVSQTSSIKYALFDQQAACNEPVECVDVLFAAPAGLQAGVADRRCAACLSSAYSSSMNLTDINKPFIHSFRISASIENWLLCATLY